MATNGSMPEWMVCPADVHLLGEGWRAWLAAIALGFFGDAAKLGSSRSILIEGLALGIAWLLTETETGTPTRGRSRVKRAHDRGNHGAGAGVHEWSRERFANATLELGREWLHGDFVAGRPTPQVAAMIVARAALTALGRASGDGPQTPEQTLFLLEPRERCGAELLRGVTAD